MVKDTVLQIRLTQDLKDWLDDYTSRKRISKTAFLTTILETIRMKDKGVLENDNKSIRRGLTLLIPKHQEKMVMSL